MDDDLPGGRERVAGIADRLTDELVDEQGRAPAAHEVAEVVAGEAERFADAPVQDFVPLLTEHAARDELRERGLHADLSRPPSDPGGSATSPEPSDGAEGPDQPD